MHTWPIYIDIGNADTRENLGKFCYLGDMLNAEGGADSGGGGGVVVGARCAWMKFIELSLILTFKGASINYNVIILLMACKLLRRIDIATSDLLVLHTSHTIKLHSI